MILSLPMNFSKFLLNFCAKIVLYKQVTFYIIGDELFLLTVSLLQTRFLHCVTRFEVGK